MDKSTSVYSLTACYIVFTGISGFAIALDCTDSAELDCKDNGHKNSAITDFWSFYPTTCPTGSLTTTTEATMYTACEDSAVRTGNEEMTF